MTTLAGVIRRSPPVWRRPNLLLVVLALVATGCAGAPSAGSGSASQSQTPVPDPPASVVADPDYMQSCAMSGIDQSPGCLQVALDAVDNARAKEGIGPMRLPADFASLPFDRQMLLVVDSERTARHLRPVVGITAGLDRLAAEGAASDGLPPSPGGGARGTRSDADAGFFNALDVDDQWLYDDGPGSGVSGCGQAGGPGCWADRNTLLAGFPPGGELVMGAAVDPTGDTRPVDPGGPSMALVVTEVTGRSPALTSSWAQPGSEAASGELLPLRSAPTGVSATGIPDPPRSEPPDPDYYRTCAPSGLDGSVACTDTVLAAIDRARSAEGIGPMVLPAEFGQLTVPAQLFVVTDLERVDRGLPPFVGLSAAMDANARRGADSAGDPPDPPGVIGDDEEWSGGSVNALDADYGWMYDDGIGSGNLDCPPHGGPGCWGHRHGILDAFGPVGAMVMGAAVDPTGDTTAGGWAGGTSMAMTLTATLHPPATYVVTWAQVEAGTVPPDALARGAPSG
jgi:hypothetical protein